jgi:hypothetical protein
MPQRKGGLAASQGAADEERGFLESVLLAGRVRDPIVDLVQGGSRVAHGFQKPVRTQRFLGFHRGLFPPESDGRARQVKFRTFPGRREKHRRGAFARQKPV